MSTHVLLHVLLLRSATEGPGRRRIMDDPRSVVARAARFARWLCAVALGCALSFGAQGATGDERLVSWLQEAAPDDAPPTWGWPNSATYPEQTWGLMAPPAPPVLDPILGTVQIDPSLPSSRRRYQVVSREEVASSAPPVVYPEQSWFVAQPLPPVQQPLPPVQQPAFVAGQPTPAMPSSRRRFQFVSEQDRQRFQFASQPDQQQPMDPDAPPEPDQPAPDSDGQTPEEAEKARAEQIKKLGKEPVTNTMQFLRTVDVLLKEGDYQWDIGFNYTLFETEFPIPITDPATGFVTNVAPGTIRRRLLYSPFAVRYGWTNDVQLFAVLPVGYTDTQTVAPGTSIMANTGGVGDLNVGWSRHLIKGVDGGTDGIITWTLTAPTGAYQSPLGIGQVIPGFALGQGYWALQGQMLFINRYDPVIVFYGAGCRHLFQRRFGSGISGERGNMITAGEQISYLLGVGFSVNDRVTLSTTLSGFYITNTQIDGVTDRGSNIEPISLRFAATIARYCRILEPFVSVGMTQTAPTASLGVTWTFY
jgi:hypothetical protein